MLKDVLKQMINLRGPISISSYMKQCLTHPQYGYYMKQDPFGSKGDFVTSPEISQMFGELVGINVLTQWMAHNKPPKCRIVELGPGRGTLMDDLLRASKAFPAFFEAIQEIQLVEASPTLKNIQKEKLNAYGKPIVWQELLKTLPRDHMPTFIIAHEFLDALPIHQFEKKEDGWREKVVQYSELQDEFQPVIGPKGTILAQAIAAQHRYNRLMVTAEIEVCPEAWDVAKEISEILSTNTGAALIMDYGPMDTIPVNTFRGFKDHKQVSPYEAPGDADLTADVDFHALKDIFTKNKSLHVHGPVNQRNWLHAMGIGARATVLSNNQNSDEGKQRIADAYNRLTDSSHMGKTYKMMAITTATEPVAGFEAPPAKMA